MFKIQLKKSVVLLVLIMGSVSSFAFQSKDKLVGNILKSTLETYHYKKLKLDAQRDLHRKYGRVNPGIKLKKVPLPVASVDNLQKVSNVTIK